MKKFLLILTSLLFILSITASAIDTGYDIRSMNLDFKVAQDGGIAVSEKLDVYYNTASHGIWRLIPLYYQMDWGTNGGEQEYHFSISNIKVTGSPYYVDKSQNAASVRLGDPDKYVTGLKSYGVDYNMSGVDPGLTSGQLFYYNMVGTDWDCNIQKTSFRIELPKDFDAAPLQVYIGAQGKTATLTKGVDYTVVGRVISGISPRVLLPGEAISVWLPLPDGYFSYPIPPDYSLLIAMVSLILAGIGIFCFFLFGKDEDYVQVVEFSSPDGLSSAELGYIIDGQVNTRDVVSLVIYWASIGCMTIDELPGGKQFEFKKLKELPPRSNPGEVAMFAAFFSGKDKTSTTLLNQNFSTEIFAAKSSIKSGVNQKGRIFDLRADVLKALFRLVTVVPAALAGFLWVLPASYEMITPLLLAGFLALLAGVASTIFISLLEGWKLHKVIERVGLSIIGLVLALLLFASLLIAALATGGALWSAGTVILSLMILTISTAFMGKRTRRGLDLYGRILGFREFIMVAEKDRIEALVAEDPQYFYKILPYAYALEVTDQWSKRFESIALPAPSWSTYSSGSMISPILYTSMLSHSMHSISNAMTAVPQTATTTGGVRGGGFGGGGFGGGGFSGGGFGGGGGGRW